MAYDDQTPTERWDLHHSGIHTQCTLAPLWASPSLRGRSFVEATDPWSAGATISGADTRVQIRNA